MAFDTDAKAIRDYVAGVVNSVWTDVEFSVEDPEKAYTGACAQISLRSIEFSEQTVGGDQAMLEFSIYSRRPISTLSSDAKIEKAHALRVGLLASVNPASVGYMPMVSRADFAQDDTVDGYWELGMTYRVMLSAARS